LLGFALWITRARVPAERMGWCSTYTHRVRARRYGFGNRSPVRSCRRRADLFGVWVAARCQGCNAANVANEPRISVWRSDRSRHGTDIATRPGRSDHADVDFTQSRCRLAGGEVTQSTAGEGADLARKKAAAIAAGLYRSLVTHSSGESDACVRAAHHLEELTGPSRFRCRAPTTLVNQTRAASSRNAPQRCRRAPRGCTCECSGHPVRIEHSMPR